MGCDDLGLDRGVVDDNCLLLERGKVFDVGVWFGWWAL